MKSAGTRPLRNVLLLWTDQQRPDTIGAYGNPQIRTPNLDRLAAGGALFERAYCAQPVCNPSRASLLTGLYPHTHGVLANRMTLPPTYPTIAELLKPHGYACGYAGKWDLGWEHDPQRGFEDFWASIQPKSRGYADRALVPFSSYHHHLVARGYSPPAGKATFGDEAAARLPEDAGKPAFLAGEAIRFLETRKDRPFFLSVNFFEPHSPYHGPLDDLYDPEQITLPASWYAPMDETVPLRYRRRREAVLRDWFEGNLTGDDERAWKELIARYWGNCTLVDKYAGRILDRLDELGLAEDTIVVYTTDHGDMMGEHRLLGKTTQYEGSMHVPLIIRVPGLAPRRIVTPTSLVDLVPTLLALLDVAAPLRLQGTDRRPLLERGDIAPEEAQVVVEWNSFHGYPKRDEQPDILDEPEDVKQRLRATAARTIRLGRWKLTLYASGEHELYHLEADPGELRNAFRDPRAASVVQDLYARLLEWQHQTLDPVVLPDPRALAVA